MFTGIIQEVGRVSLAVPGKLTVAASRVLQGMELGGSIAVNGACLTVTQLDAGSFSVDVMAETLRRTNLGQLKTGDRVNLEPPLSLGGQLGGHLVQGHVDGTVRVASMARSQDAIRIRFEASPELMRYVVEKGFVSLDGISFTVVTRDAASFEVSVVDFTRRHTTVDGWQVGNLVNLEVDIIAKYVEQLTQVRGTGITVEFLQKHGFLVSQQGG